MSITSTFYLKARNTFFTPVVPWNMLIAESYTESQSLFIDFILFLFIVREIPSFRDLSLEISKKVNQVVPIFLNIPLTFSRSVNFKPNLLLNRRINIRKCPLSKFCREKNPCSYSCKIQKSMFYQVEQRSNAFQVTTGLEKYVILYWTTEDVEERRRCLCIITRQMVMRKSLRPPTLILCQVTNIETPTRCMLVGKK